MSVKMYLNVGRVWDEILEKRGGIVRDPMFVVCCVINNNMNYEVI